MRKIQSVSVMIALTVMVMVFGGVIPSVAQQNTVNWDTLDSSTIVPGELLVKFKKVGKSELHTVAAIRANAHASVGAQLERRYRLIDWDQVSLPSGTSLRVAAAQYEANPAVEMVEPNYIVHADATPNDPRYGELWGMERINAPQAWDFTTGSTNIVVGVIDTGINLLHEDLVDNLWTNPGESGLDSGGQDKRFNGIDDDGNGYIDDYQGWDFVNNDNDPTDGYGHGSHCSGTIGGTGNNGKGVAGVNWSVKIVGLKFLSDTGSGSTADAIDAVLYAANLSQYIKFTSNSWGGGGFSQALKDAINVSDQLFVAAAGNDSKDNDSSPSYPASYDLPNIISVASITSSGSLSDFSNYGKISVDIAAPGSAILSCGADSPTDYMSWSGTSMACPHVAGAAALLWSVNPAATWQEIRDAILNNAAPNSALNGKVATDGELDVYASFVPVTPSDDYLSSGDPGVGPYLPSNKIYTIYNVSASPVNWAITATEPWLIVPGVVTVPAASSVDVVISVDQALAATYAEGAYSDDISFVNTSTGLGNTTRHVVLRIGDNYKVFSTTYDWIDPVNSGHAAVSVIGGRSTAKTIPFNFNYYSTNYSAVYVADSGIAGFVDVGLNPDDNGIIPLPDLPNNILAPMWDNIEGGTMYVGTEGTTPDRKFVISWIDMTHGSDPSVNFSFQAIINETSSTIDINDIICQYKSVSQDEETFGAGRSATIGIEDIDGLLGRTYSINGATLLADKQALLFTMNNVVDTTPPTGQVTVLSHTANSVKFDIRFNEIVAGLDISDLVLSGNAAGATINSVNGSGERYVATVSFGSGLGSIGIGVQAGAVLDIAGLANDEVAPAYYVIPISGNVFSDSMLDGSNDWAVSEGEIGIYLLDGWEWGLPTDWFGPTDGSNCWGTMLDGVYSNNMNAWLESPVIHVSENPVVEFDLWYEIEDEYDFGYIEVNAGMGWVNVTPGNYYTGDSMGWISQQIELDSVTFANKDLRIRFRFTSDSTITRGGMYLRNFAVKSQFDHGIWIYSLMPGTATVSTVESFTLQAYNMTTTTYHNVHGLLSSAASGIGIADGSVIYGDMVPGQLSTAVPLVSATIGAPNAFVDDTVVFGHSVTTDEGDWFENNVELQINGITPDQTNIITAMTSGSVTDWLNRPIRGDGGENSGLIQLIYAGSDGTNDPAAAGGASTGDDVVLYESTTMLTYGRFGSGGVAADSGKFSVDFLHNLSVSDKVYVRAWDGSSYTASRAYGDSSLQPVVASDAQIIDFGSWQVGVPASCDRDSNGDTVPDGWYVKFGGDPDAPIGPLSPDWTADAVAGEYGASSGKMAYPEAIATWQGFVFVADTRNDRIQVWNADLSINISEVGSFGTGTDELNWPAGLVVNEAARQLVVADTGNNRIVVYDIDSTNGNLTSSFEFGSTGSGNLQFNKPRGVALDSAGNIYVADQANNRIQIFDNTGAYLRSISGISAQPVSVALDSAGKIYALLSSISTVNVYENNGTFSASFGGAGSGDGQFSQPADIKIGVGDRIYVVDKSNHRVEILSSSYAYLAEYGVQGIAEGELKYPQGMCLTASGGLYVADTWNHRVQSLSMILDADGDGMDDFWEDANGLDSSDPDDWAADPDGDGLSNIGEYRVGTDPQNRDTNGNGIWDGAEVRMCADPLGPFDGVVIDNVWYGSGLQSLSWNGDAGAEYDVEIATDLISANWTVIDTVTAISTGVYGWTNNIVQPGPLYYYRVIRK